ncbi:hypothetical protein M8J75_000342 [Diaphorina citri]|nr:hypothetical protein M8J75_000342 [Diaphorina citri]
MSSEQSETRRGSVFCVLVANVESSSSSGDTSGTSGSQLQYGQGEFSSDVLTTYEGLIYFRREYFPQIGNS